MSTLATTAARISPEEYRPSPPKSGSTVWRNLKKMAVIASFLGLGALNVLTLVNDNIHAAAYGVVKMVVANSFVEAIGRFFSSNPILINSPTNKRNLAINVGTEKLLAEKAMLIAANRTLENKHEILAKSHKMLEEKHKTSTAALKTFSSKVAARTIKNATRNITGMAGEAIPYIGVTVMVAVTALDIEDACNNMRDLNEMNNTAGLATEDATKVCGMIVPTKDQILAQVRQNWRAGYKTATDSVNQVKKILPPQPPEVSLSQAREFMSAVFTWFH
jgi:hypothetical protein